MMDLWIKTLHVLAVISWMAGLLYLPRLLVYHASVAAGSEQDHLFRVMEYRLYRYIMRPAFMPSSRWSSRCRPITGFRASGSEAFPLERTRGRAVSFASRTRYQRF